MANNNCKFYKVVRQVSYDNGSTWVNIGETQKGDLYEYDSAECGAVTQYRWVDVTGAYTCEGTTKYQKTKRQVSTDGGTTWQDVSPAEYGKGDMIETESIDCGYDTAYSGQYLTFIAREDTAFQFRSWIYESGDRIGKNSIYYSLDGGNTWTKHSNLDNSSNNWTPVVKKGNKILWKGNFTPNFCEPFDGDYQVLSFNNSFKSNGKFDVVGNVMSLYYSDNFRGKTSLANTFGVFIGLFRDCDGLINANNMVLPATTLGERCYDDMFGDCSNLITFPVLPATTLANFCYDSMFDGCTSLTTAPVLPVTNLSGAIWCYCTMFRGCTSLTTPPALPATSLARRCYQQMFENCTNLTTAPSLAATTLEEYCYGAMFRGCTSLTTAPDLTAPTLVEGCYSAMFVECSSLSHIKCLATNISASRCVSGWVDGVSSSGTFVKASSMNNWSTGVNGIPTNWTVQNA